MIKIIGLIAAVMLPIWNIPLIYRIGKRKSSQDVSLYWAFGVWICMILMLPSAFVSTDIVYKVFSVSNILFFSIVVFQVVRFWKRG